MKKRLITGAVLSPPDARDYSIALAGQYPASFILPRLPGARNQGSVGSCSAHAGAGAGECYDGIRYSTDFLHGYRPAGYYDGEGISVREICKTMREAGNVPYADMPGNTHMPAVRQKVMAKAQALLAKAAPNKIERYARLYSADEIKTALSCGMPVIIVSMIYADFKAAKDGALTNTPASGGGCAHAMLIVGWDDGKKGFLTLNSWGTGWGDKGYCRYPYAHIASERHMRELWAIADTYRAGLIARTLRKGHTGSDVRIMQQALMAKGYGLPIYGADGDFGAETDTAVRKFQAQNGLTADGLAGKLTLGALGV